MTFEVAVDTFYPSGPEELAAMSGANTTSLMMVQFSRIVKYETVRVQYIEFLISILTLIQVKLGYFLLQRSLQTVIRIYRAIPQYPGHLHREILIFSQKPLRTICIYHLVPFKLPKNVQRCPFQGLLVLEHFFQKISNFAKYVLTPTF